MLYIPQPQYEDFDPDNFDDEFGDGLDDSDFDSQGLHSRAREDVDLIRGRGTPHSDWDAVDNHGTYNIQRPAAGVLPSGRRLNSGYGAMCHPYVEGHMSLTDQERADSMVRGEPSQPESAIPWDQSIQDQNKRRRVQRQWTKPYLTEMAAAHAERRSPVVHVPTTTTGKPIGLRSAWHRQVRLVARQTMDHSIRSYVGKKGTWWKVVQKIHAALDEVFTYDHPLCANYLSKYLKSAVKNDRLEWKEHFIATHGEKHERCPDEAFATLRKYWVSIAGKAESEQMAALRLLGPQKTSSLGSRGRKSTSTPLSHVSNNHHEPLQILVY